MSSKPTVVAVVDDEQSVRKALARLFRSAGLAVETFGSGSEFLDSMGARQPDCVVLDLHMPEMDGFEVQTCLARLDPRLPVIVVTGHDSEKNRVRALQNGARAYLSKPVDDGQLLGAIRRALAGEGKPNGGGLPFPEDATS